MFGAVYGSSSGESVRTRSSLGWFVCYFCVELQGVESCVVREGRPGDVL